MIRTAEPKGLRSPKRGETSLPNGSAMILLFLAKNLIEKAVTLSSRVATGLGTQTKLV